jgi:hypothetical protein
MPDEDREKCHADLLALRTGGELPERAYRLLERLVARMDREADRLDRLETGSFQPEETPTKPERTKSSDQLPAVRGWSNKGVLDALKKPEP